MRRSPRDIVEDHLRLRAEGRLEDDLERNYAEDIVLLDAYGAHRGLDAVRNAASRLARACPDAVFEYLKVEVEGDYGFLLWRADGSRKRIEDGTDSFVVRGGVIVSQTIAYRVVD